MKKDETTSVYSEGNHNYADRRPWNCAEIVKYSESDPLTFAEIILEYSTSPTAENSPRQVVK